MSAPAGRGIDQALGSAKLPGLTPAVASKLAKGLGVATVRDLLEQVPRRYVDLSRQRTIRELKVGEEATTTGTVHRVDGRYVRSRRHLLTVTVGDGTGYLRLVWWNQPFRTRAFRQGEAIVVAGRLERDRRGSPSIVNPFVEPIGGPSVHVGRVIPVHPATQGVSPTQIRRFVHEALERFGDEVDDPLPAGIEPFAGAPGRAAALRELHFPTDERRRALAHRRLVFEELFVLSAGLGMRKHRLREEATGRAHVDGSLAERFLQTLPFEPTGAQRRAVGEVEADMAGVHPMNRLLQGEVGSGKTIVAVAAAMRAAGSGCQTAFMAPTEVLAEQHYLTVRALLEPLAGHAPAPDGTLFGGGFEVVLLTGSVTGAERTRVLARVASGEATIVVGTHALIQEGVSFRSLGLAIVDEQHRFGVHQRVLLRTKGGEDEQPDVLIMTATPIPRTLALTLYGDLDVSTLDEMPAGRRPVETHVVSDEPGRERAYADVRAEAAAGRQAFLVCPLVEDSEAVAAKAATSEYERLRAEVFTGLRVGLVHGRMRPAEKEDVMRAMRSGELDVLVATTVIEVGVDLPRATVMIVEDADRFGLSQLHQLRGRIGRGSDHARCYLFTSLEGSEEEGRDEARQRLRAMEATTDGFALAELDLEIRGAGHLFGRGAVEEAGGAPIQAGRGDLRFANLVRHQDVLAEARRAALAVVAADPTLSSSENAPLLAEIKRRFADRLDWLFAS
ncbi:MAG TPA: ATP-dependent DNA helicase RecG [Actinomycetota bacterium]